MNALRLSGCGTQHPHRALGGTRILLAAAPTTPPCFRHWRRSSSLRSGHIQRKEYFIICSSGKSADFPELPFHGWHRVSDDGRGKLSSQKQKSGHSGGQAECPVFVFFASAVVPNTAGAAPEAAEQTVLPLPVEKRKEWRNGAERLQTLLFSGATRLELANRRCENRIPQTVSLVNP